jgi:predicted metal-dependent phosphoesterase TrpH
LVVPAFLSLCVAAGALAPAPVLTDPVVGGPAARVHLEKSAAYVFLSPWCELLDGVTALGMIQHRALLLSTLAAALLAALFIARRGRAGALRTLGIVAAGLIAGTGAHALLLGAAGWLPRPMAALRTDDPDRMIIDFHSHSDHSHDGRPGLSVMSNRRWHSRTGFHTAYLTDHNSQEGIGAAASGNPAVAGTGTTLLPGTELSLFRMHIVVLGEGVEAATVGIRTNRAASLDFLRDLTRRKDAVTIASTPEWALKSWMFVPWLAGGLVDGFEVITGVPRAMEVPGEKLKSVIALAGEKKRLLVAGSDYHGLGKAAYAWSLIDLPGWRALSPALLHRAVIAAMKDGAAPVATVVRSPFGPGAGWAKELVAVALPVGILRRLTRAERLSWLAWIWAGFLLPRLPRRRRPAKS